MERKFSSVDEYIQTFPLPVQELLNLVRETIKENAPDATEEIAYGMPAYKTHKKPLVYFAGFAKHIGFYATPTGHKVFESELSKYKQRKGSVQFSLNQSLPFDLIADIVRFRVKENIQKNS